MCVMPVSLLVPHDLSACSGRKEAAPEDDLVLQRSGLDAE